MKTMSDPRLNHNDRSQPAVPERTDRPLQAEEVHSPHDELLPEELAAGLEDDAAHKKSGFPWIVVAAAVILVGVALALGWFLRVHPRPQEARAAAPATVHVVRPEPISSSNLTLPGVLQANQETTLYARTNGYLQRWYVDIGAQVKEGDLLAEITAPDVDAQLLQARAQLDQSRAVSQVAQLNFDRAKQLINQRVSSQQEYDNSQASRDQAAASVKAAEANVRNLGAQQSFQKIVAPFAGVVTARYVDDGALISAGPGTSAASGGSGGDPAAAAASGGGQPLFRLARVDLLRVYLDVPQSDALEVRAGIDAELVLAERPRANYHAKVSRTAGALEPSTRTLRTEVEVPNNSGELLAGMYVQVRLILPRQQNAFALPASAVVTRGDGGPPQVLTLDPQRRVHSDDVVLGRDRGATIEVIGGLAASDVVITNPSDALTEGTIVNVAGTP